MSEFLIYKKVQLPSKKTLDIYVNSLSGVTLGVINWYAPWRRYVFRPTLLIGTNFDSSCLKEITEYINKLMQERKNVKET